MALIWLLDNIMQSIYFRLTSRAFKTGLHYNLPSI